MLSINVSNFLGAESADLDLPGLTVVHGKNGSGKTSILDALRWCLTNDRVRYKTYEESIRRGAKAASCCLTVGAVEYLRRRTRTAETDAPAAVPWNRLHVLGVLGALPRADRAAAFALLADEVGWQEEFVKVNACVDILPAPIPWPTKDSEADAVFDKLCKLRVLAGRDQDTARGSITTLERLLQEAMTAAGDYSTEVLQDKVATTSQAVSKLESGRGASVATAAGKVKRLAADLATAEKGILTTEEIAAYQADRDVDAEIKKWTAEAKSSTKAADDMQAMGNTANAAFTVARLELSTLEALAECCPAGVPGECAPWAKLRPAKLKAAREKLDQCVRSAESYPSMIASRRQTAKEEAGKAADLAAVQAQARAAMDADVAARETAARLRVELKEAQVAQGKAESEQTDGSALEAAKVQAQEARARLQAAQEGAKHRTALDRARATLEQATARHAAYDKLAGIAGPKGARARGLDAVLADFANHAEVVLEAWGMSLRVGPETLAYTALVNGGGELPEEGWSGGERVKMGAALSYAWAVSAGFPLAVCDEAQALDYRGRAELSNALAPGISWLVLAAATKSREETAAVPAGDVSRWWMESGKAERI